MAGLTAEGTPSGWELEAVMYTQSTQWILWKEQGLPLDGCLTTILVMVVEATICLFVQAVWPDAMTF